MAGTDWIQYENTGAVRNKPLSPDLVSALSFLPDLGITMRVFSGGQDGIGEGTQRTGSTRHDHGDAGDVFFYKDGRKLDWNNPEDIPIFQEIVSKAHANGVTGFGAGDGYMQPGSMHIGFGSGAVWGAGGKGDNAPDWLRTAYGMPASGGTGSYGGPAPAQSGSPQMGANTLAAPPPPNALALPQWTDMRQDVAPFLNPNRGRNALGMM